jgi:site-specific recombinase XerD
MFLVAGEDHFVEQAGIRHRFGQHQLRHAHAVELARE